MHNLNLKLGIIVFTFFVLVVLVGWLPQEKQTSKEDFPILKSPYLGQKPPGMTPEVFAPGIISTEKSELNSVFTPDGKEFYFTIKEPNKGYTIMYTKQEKNQWLKPKIVPFSGIYSDVDMCISHDGKRMFFCSMRPLRKGGKSPKGIQIWSVARVGNSWGEPKNLGSPVNDGEMSVYPTITRDGTLYFQSRRPGGFGGRDVYRSRYVNGTYQEPENLGNAINSQYNEGDVFIAPDESFLIVCIEHPDSYGEGDLYISFRKEDGSWTKAKNMGKTINSSAYEYCPMLSPDGKYLFFTSKQTGNGDIYWVDAKIIEIIKTKELK